MKQVKTVQKNATQTEKKLPVVKTGQETPSPRNKTRVKVEPSLEDRIQKADELKSLTLKRQRTIKTLHHLRSFSFASDDNCTLTIRDSERQEFETSNSNLVGLLKSYLINLLGDKVSELDDEILAFNL